MREIAEQSFNKLKAYVEHSGFKGWDPYDGLNSKLFQKLPIKNWPLARLAWIQLFKRSPFNLRPLMGVERDFNSKGLGLFLSGYCFLYKKDPTPQTLESIRFLTKSILEMRQKGYSGSCWGYNFDWQARAFFQPKGTPTVVATTYVAYALLDAYEILDNQELLNIARSSCDFVLNDLNRTMDENGNFCFSYSPLDKTQVFNASLLGSRLLARVYSYTGEKHLLDAARKSIYFCCEYQQPSGAWAYGTLPFHQWVDNFHTGFNLECIYEFQKYAGEILPGNPLEKGLQYYLENFFTKDGASKYFNTSLYPVDVHAPAQLIVTLYRLGRLTANKKLVDKVLAWTIEHMQSPKGYFFYQKKQILSSKIPYMRWAQAWMFYSLSCYLTSHETA